MQERQRYREHLHIVPNFQKQGESREEVVYLEQILAVEPDRLVLCDGSSSDLDSRDSTKGASSIHSFEPPSAGDTLGQDDKSLPAPSLIDHSVSRLDAQRLDQNSRITLGLSDLSSVTKYDGGLGKESFSSSRTGYKDYSGQSLGNPSSPKGGEEQRNFSASSKRYQSPANEFRQAEVVRQTSPAKSRGTKRRNLSAPRAKPGVFSHNDSTVSSRRSDWQRSKVEGQTLPSQRRNLSSSWRPVALAKAKAAQKANRADFVPWHARDARELKSGPKENEDGDAPLPYNPVDFRQFKRSRAKAAAMKSDLELERQKATRLQQEIHEQRLRLKAQSKPPPPRHNVSTMTQTDLPAQVPPSFASALQLPTLNNAQRRPDKDLWPEAHCFRVLRGENLYQSLPVLGTKLEGVCGTETNQGELEERSHSFFKQRLKAMDLRLKRSFRAIRDVLRHRQLALEERIAVSRNELEQVLLELGRQKEIQRRACDKENLFMPRVRQEAPQLQQPPFLGGIRASESNNRRSWQSVARSLGSKDSAKKKNPWDGGDFKIGMLEDLATKLRAKLALDAMYSHTQLARMRRRLCLERAMVLEKRLLLPAWGSLVLLHRGRQWLRERCVQRAAERRFRLCAAALRPWHALAQASVIEQGKALAAAEFLRQKRQWRAFAAWRARVCVIGRYDALLHIRASQWANRICMRRALAGWRGVYIRAKVLRARLGLAIALGGVHKLAKGIGPEAIETWNLQVPFSQTLMGIRLGLRRGKAHTRINLDQSMHQTLLGQAVAAVQGACFGVVENCTRHSNRYSNEESKSRGNRRENESLSDEEELDEDGNFVTKWKLAVWRRKAARGCYLALGRLANTWFRSSTKSRHAEKHHAAKVRAALFKTYAGIGIGRLAAKPLRSHVRALNSFCRGDSLFYYQTGGGLPHSAIRGFASQQAEFDQWDEVDRGRCRHISKIDAPVWFKGWRSAMANETYARQLLGKILSAWRGFALELTNDRAARALLRHSTISKSWRALLLNARQCQHRTILAEESGDHIRKRDAFAQWREYNALWRRRALGSSAYWSLWSRWRRWAWHRGLCRQKIVRLKTKHTYQRVFRRWRQLHVCRRLLVRVFSLYEERALRRQVLEQESSFLRDYRLLGDMFENWHNFKIERQQAHWLRVKEAEADFMYRNRLLPKVFGAWRDVERWYGSPRWDPSPTHDQRLRSLATHLELEQLVNEGSFGTALFPSGFSSVVSGEGRALGRSFLESFSALETRSENTDTIDKMAM